MTVIFIFPKMACHSTLIESTNYVDVSYLRYKDNLLLLLRGHNLI